MEGQYSSVILRMTGRPPRKQTFRVPRLLIKQLRQGREIRHILLVNLQGEHTCRPEHLTSPEGWDAALNLAVFKNAEGLISEQLDPEPGGWEPIPGYIKNSPCDFYAHLN